jgi:transposase
MKKEVKAARKRGRPTRFSKALGDEIVALIEAGNYAETACAIVGINKTTFYQWLKDGARATAGSKRDFSNAVKRASGIAERDDLAVIEKAAKGYTVVEVRVVNKPIKLTRRITNSDGSVVVEERVEFFDEKTIAKVKKFDWKASAWRLERRHPDRFGRKVAIDATISDGEDKDPADMSDKELDAFLASAGIEFED